MDAVSRGIVEQRRRTRPPNDVPAAPKCVPNARPITTLPTRDLELAVAALCVLDGQDWRRAVLPPALMEQLTREHAAAAPDQGECSTPFIGKVVGWSTWGDPIELQLWHRCAVAGSPWTPDAELWHPSAGLADDLAALSLGPRVKQR